MPTARGARSGGFSAFTERLQKPSAPAENGAAAQNGSAPVAAAAPGRAAPPARELSLPEVQRLLEDLRAAVVGLAFQKALDSVRSKDWGALKKRAGVAKLLSFAWKAPLKASGFAIDAYSFPRVLAAVRTHAAQPGIKTLAEEVEKLLKFFPGALFGSNAGKMKGSANNAALKEASSGRGAFSKMSNGSGQEKRPEPAPAPASAPAAPALRPGALRGRPMGLGEAKDILKRLKEESLKKEFQEGLAELSRSNVPDVQKNFSHFVCKQWAEAMKFYEFPVSPDGFREMADGIQRCAYNRHVEMLAHEVEEKIRVPKGSFFGIAASGGDEGEEEEPAGGGAQGGRPDEVGILLRHNQLGTELTVDVPTTATFWDLKVEAARLLGCGDIKTKGRLVRKSNAGTFVSYKDSDQLGTVREVIVLGAELTPLPGAVQEPRAPRHAGSSAAAAASFRLRFEDMTPRVTSQLQKPAAAQDLRTPELTKEQAQQLLRELHSGYGDADFQRRLRRFHADLGTTTQFSKERQRLALTVQSVVLPKYGFRGSIDGVLDMQKALGPFVMQDPEMQKIAAECDDLLLANARVKKKPKAETVDGPQAGANKEKVQPEPEQPPKGPATDPEPEPPSRLEPQKPLVPATEVYFVVRHAHNQKDEEVWLKAMSTATFLQIKHVLAAKLGRDEVRTKGRLVYRAEGGAGVWTDFPDEEELGRNRKVLHIMGISMPSRECGLVVRHAIKQDCPQVDLRIWTHWKFREVKEALGTKLGRPEISKQAKFVFKPNSTSAQGAWAAFKDEEQVGGSRNELFVMGDFDLEPTAEAKEEAQGAAREPAKEEVDQAALAKRAAEEMEMKKSEDAKKKVKERKDKKVKEVVQELEKKEREEAERKAKEEADRKAKEEAREAAERRKKEEAERKAREERERKEREEAQRKEKEEAEREAKEEAEGREKEEAERKAKEEADRRERDEAAAAREAKEEEERRDREESERKAKEEAERRQKEEADLTAKEETEGREREEAERKAKEEAERREREEAELKGQQEAERREREEAERKSAEEAERRAKEEAERKAKEEAERRAVERKAKEEAERRAAAAKEEAERKAREEGARTKREEAERRKREAAEEAERKAREEEERKDEEELERVKAEAKARVARQAKEEAERRAKELKEKAERKAKEEAELQAKEEAKRKAKAESERKAKEEADRKALAMKAPPRPSQREIVKNMPLPAIPNLPRRDDAKLWIVVGGEDKGGILVRKGESFESKPFPIRLQTGARVEEQEIVGNRFHYKRIYGDGPDFGWVNIKLNEKVLLEPYELGDM